MLIMGRHVAYEMFPLASFYLTGYDQTIGWQIAFN